MISKNLESITNYLWHQSTKRINSLLIDEPNFNISDYYYLTAIYNMDHPNFGDVAQALNLTKPAVSALIKRLIRHGLIEKVQCDQDKRIFYLSITPKGKQMIEGSPDLYEQLETTIASTMTPHQLQELDGLLQVVSSFLNSGALLNQNQPSQHSF